MEYIVKKKDIKLNEYNFYIVIDFDQTITSSMSQNSWDAILKSEYIRKEHLEKHLELQDKYKPIEIDNTLNFEYRKKIVNEWYNLVLELFYKYVEDEEIIRKAVKNSKLEFRKGAKEFLKKMENKNIPVIIVSGGIGNTIQEFLKKENANYNNIEIISNIIDFHKKKTNNIVHALNKSEIIWDKHIMNKINKKEYAILIGDVIADINMLPKENKSTKLTIGFLDNNIENLLEMYKQNFDIVLTNNSTFNKVDKILENIIQNK